MAVNDIIIPGGAVGAAAGVSLNLPANGSLTLTNTTPNTNDINNLLAAIADGGTRVYFPANWSYAPPDPFDMGAGNIQLLATSGKWTLNLATYLGPADEPGFVNLGADVFLGNMEALMGIGVSTSNTLHGMVNFDVADADNLYLYQCTRIMNVSPGGTEHAEGLNVWRNTDAGPERATLHGVYNGPFRQYGKFVTTGAFNQGTAASGQVITLYRCISYSWQRYAFAQHGSKIDVVNCVIPNHVDRIDALLNSGGQMNVRGCWVGSSSQRQSGSAYRYEITGGVNTYAPTAAGTGNDRNITESSPDGLGPLISASRSSAWNFGYTFATPTAMTSTVKDAIVAGAGAGVVDIQIDGGGFVDGDPPSSRGYAAAFQRYPVLRSR